MIEVVVGDVHGRVDLLRALLRALGALDSHEHRRRGFWIVQVGDLLDRRASREANLEVARLAVESLDVVLAGNHEVEMSFRAHHRTRCSALRARKPGLAPCCGRAQRLAGDSRRGPP